MVTLPGSEMGTPKFPEPITLTFLVLRHINFSDATPDELEQLAQACEPASFGVHHEQVLDESYRKAGKMDSECFASTLDLVRTDLVNIIRDCLLEGTQSTKNIKAELYKLNVYGTRLILVLPVSGTMLLSRQRVVLQASRRYSPEREDVWLARRCLSNVP